MLGPSKHFGATLLGAVLAGGWLAACSGSEAPQTPAFQTPGSQPVITQPAGAAGSGSLATAGTPTTSAPGPTASTPQATVTAGSAAPAMQTSPATAPTDGSGAGVSWCNVKHTFTTRCVVCHDGQGTAGSPMALKTYADLQAPAVSDASVKVVDMVKKRIHDPMKPMPPQQNLSDQEMQGLDAWLTAGAPEGPDPSCASVPGANDPATQPKQEWPTNCDEEYKILVHGDGGPGTPYMVGPGQEMHPQIAVQAPWGNDTIQAIAWRAISDNSKVLHHWILYGSQRQFLAGWAPGKDDSAPLPPDVGLEMTGGTLTMDMHYNNLMGTTEEGDQSGLEICALNKDHFRPKSAGVYMGFAQYAISIPPHATNYDVTGTCMVNATEPITLLAASPHAHYLGTHMKFTVTRQSGDTVVMHDRAFDFNEQGMFPLNPPVIINTGDVVTTTCTYNNTTDQTVTFGENTENEMCYNFAVYYPVHALSCAGGLGGFPGGGFPGF